MQHSLHNIFKMLCSAVSSQYIWCSVFVLLPVPVWVKIKQSQPPFWLIMLLLRYLCVPYTLQLTVGPNSKQLYAEFFLLPLPHLIVPWVSPKLSASRQFCIGVQVAVSLQQTTLRLHAAEAKIFEVNAFAAIAVKLKVNATTAISFPANISEENSDC